MRLDEISEEYGDDVVIEWRSFLLRPEPEPRPLAAFTKYTKSWERPGGLEPRTTFQEWSGDHQPPSHSVPSAVAGKVAGLQGAEAYHRYSRGLFSAYFTQNRTISDRGVLGDIATEAGLDRERFDADWDREGEQLEQAVFSDYLTAVNSQITGVPAVVVDRTWLLPGAVDTDDYRRQIAEARARRS